MTLHKSIKFHEDTTNIIFLLAVLFFVLVVFLSQYYLRQRNAATEHLPEPHSHVHRDLCVFVHVSSCASINTPLVIATLSSCITFLLGYPAPPSQEAGTPLCQAAGEEGV